jgi:muramoyltetrapeptide carboxypeptidase LdcA involved in peptidoglycan recycling
MTPAGMQSALERAKQTLENSGLSAVFLLCYDAKTKKFSALAGDSLGAKSRLQELRDYANEQLEAM